jgi:L-alanine-DL-glutamate epimerase-like enolase superfamily enzyme
MDGRGSHPRRACAATNDLNWLEEPIIPDDIAGHTRIMAAGGVPIAAGENLRSLWEFKNYIALAHCRTPNPMSPIAVASQSL